MSLYFLIYYSFILSVASICLITYFLEQKNIDRIRKTYPTIISDLHKAVKAKNHFDIKYQLDKGIVIVDEILWSIKLEQLQETASTTNNMGQCPSTIYQLKKLNQTDRFVGRIRCLLGPCDPGEPIVVGTSLLPFVSFYLSQKQENIGLFKEKLVSSLINLNL